MAIASSPEIVLYNLVSNATTNAGARVYPLRIPDTPTYPLFVYSLVSDTVQMTRNAPASDSVGSNTAYIDNEAGLNRYQMQLDAYGETYEASRLLVEQATPYLQGFSGNVTGDSGETIRVDRVLTSRQSTGFETGGELYRQSLSVVMWLNRVTT